MSHPVRRSAAKLPTILFLVVLASIALFAQSGPSITGLSPNSGGVGTPVIITGADFGPSSENGTVMFNSVSAQPSGWSAAMIKVSVPVGAATGKVIVTVNGQASNQMDFTVTASSPSATNGER